jgi:hypothetical protein
MAARLNRLHQESVKARIQATQLILRLQNHALGKLKRKMSASQVKAAYTLLKFVISEAPKVLAGDPDNPLVPAEGFRPTELPEEALLAIAAGRKASYKDGVLVIEDKPNGEAKPNGHAGNGSVH